MMKFKNVIAFYCTSPSGVENLLSLKASDVKHFKSLPGATFCNWSEFGEMRVTPSCRSVCLFGLKPTARKCSALTVSHSCCLPSHT